MPAQPQYETPHQTRDQPTSLRGLKALVGVLAVLIVLGTALVIGVVIQRIYARPAAPSMILPTPTITTLLPGEHIAGIAGAGTAIAIWVTGPAGDRLFILNPITGATALALAAAAQQK